MKLGLAAFAAATALCAASAQAQPVHLEPTSLDFGTVPSGTSSPAMAVRVSNFGTEVLTVSSIALPAQFTQAHDCGAVAVGGNCTIQVTFRPPLEPGPIGSAATFAGDMQIFSNGAGSPHAVALTGRAEKTLVGHFYRSILRREPDAQGAAFWASEAQRMVGLGANVNETWFAMAAFFFRSAEYASFGRDDAGFVFDLYRTFFNRTPDSGGQSFWLGQLAQGMPREVVLTAFTFSAEFAAFTQAIFGNTAARAEMDAIMDMYRGFLGRLPDDAGFYDYINRVRSEQCGGTRSSIFELLRAFARSFLADHGEYYVRGRTFPQTAGDLYNAILRRGGDLQGVQHWIQQLSSGPGAAYERRYTVLDAFLQSAEFSARLDAIVAQGCIVPGTVRTVWGPATPSIALGPDGLLSMAFGANGMAFRRCLTEDCGSVSQYHEFLSGQTVSALRLQIGTDGLPVMGVLTTTLYSNFNRSYTARALHCSDTECTAPPGESTLAVSPPVLESDTTMAFAAPASGGLPLAVLTATLGPGGDAGLVNCLDAACSSAAAPVSVSPPVVENVVVERGAGGLPIVAFIDRGSDRSKSDLTVVNCTDAACSSHTTSVPLPERVSSFAFTVGADGAPRIAYPRVSSGNRVLTVLRCGNAACTSGNTLSDVMAVAPSDSPQGLRIRLSADGVPTVAFTRVINRPNAFPVAVPTVVRCADADCAAPSSVGSLDALGSTNFGSVDLALDSQGRPYLAVRNNQWVRIVHCTNADCR